MVLVVVVVLLAMLVAAFVVRYFVRSGGLLHGLPYADLDEGRANISGKWVVLTGGTSGMGEQVLGALLKMGARVVLGCITMAEGEAVKARLKQRHADACVLHELNLVHSDSIDAFAAFVTSLRKEVAVLIHCAGVAGQADVMVRVHALGPARLTRLLRPVMAPRGRVVFVASDSHALGTIDMTDFEATRRFPHVDTASVFGIWIFMRAYGTSKLMQLSWMVETAAREMGDVTYNAVQPGAVNTPMGEQHLSSLGLVLIRALKSFFFKSPWQGAQSIIFAATSSQCQNWTGRAICNNALWKFVNPILENRNVTFRVWERIERIQNF